MKNWRYVNKLRASGKRGVIVGLAIAGVICLLVAIICFKYKWIKEKLESLHYEFEDFCCDDCCESEEDCNCDENGCAYTSDSDFV